MDDTVDSFLRNYISQLYNYDLVVRFITAFHPWRKHIATLVGMTTNLLESIVRYAQFSPSYIGSIKSPTIEQNRAAKEFWFRLQKYDYNALVTQPHHESGELVKPNIKKIVKYRLGRIDLSNNCIVYYDLSKEFNDSKYIISLRTVCTQLSKMRNTIISLDLSCNNINEDLDRLLDELVHHTTLTELKLNRTKIHTHVEELSRLTTLTRLEIKNNYGPSYEELEKIRAALPTTKIVC